MDKIVWQAPHAIDDKGAQFLASLTEKERELHKLATEMLGSSYFVEKTHAFNKWKSTTSPNKPPPGAK